MKAFKPIISPVASRRGYRQETSSPAPTVIPPPNAEGRTVWVTRERPKIDRIACPWLIRRFIDPEAVFLFVAASEVPAVAQGFNAVPFDIEGVYWSHRGETCTFDTMLTEFGLKSAALNRLADIVRGADTARLDLAPQASGFLAASLGLSQLFDDDLAQLEAGMTLYDAMYLWCRDASERRTIGRARRRREKPHDSEREPVHKFCTTVSRAILGRSSLLRSRSLHP